MVAENPNSARNEFQVHLLMDCINKFELVYAYVGLRREVSCLYTMLEVRWPSAKFRCGLLTCAFARMDEKCKLLRMAYLPGLPCTATIT